MATRRGSSVRAAWVGVALVVGGLASAPLARAETRWTMPSEYPATAMPGEASAAFSRELAVASGGTLLTEPRPEAGNGLTSAKIADEVASGRLSAGDSFAGALGPLDPLFDLSSLPFATGSLADAHRLADLARPAYAAALAARGLHLAYLVPWPASGIWSKTALARPEDVAALSIRTYDQTSSRVFAAAGAKAEAISFGAVAPRLADGSLDAVLSSGDGGAGRRLWEKLPHFTAVNYAFPLSFGLVNAATYAALPEAERVALDRAGTATETAMWRLVETRLDANYGLMRRNGVAIAVEPPPAVVALLVRAAESVLVDWRVRTPQGAAILDELRKH